MNRARYRWVPDQHHRRRPSVKISNHFLNSPSVYSLTPGEFRKLLLGVAGFATLAPTEGVTDRLFCAFAVCNKGHIEKFLDLGLLLRTKGGQLTYAPDAFEIVRPGQRIRQIEGEGWTYLIQRGLDGPVKIGSTYKDPLKRLSDLQTAHDVKLHLVGFTEGAPLERELHETFADRRLHGEWFDVSVLEEITFYGRLFEEDNEA